MGGADAGTISWPNRRRQIENAAPGGEAEERGAAIDQRVSAG